MSNYTLITSNGRVTIRRDGWEHAYTEQQLQAMVYSDIDPIWSEALNLLRMTRGEDIRSIGRRETAVQIGLFDE